MRGREWRESGERIRKERKSDEQKKTYSFRLPMIVLPSRFVIRTQISLGTNAGLHEVLAELLCRQWVGRNERGRKGRGRKDG